jgi:predicted DNA-binding transcriptional regulator AlpA
MTGLLRNGVEEPLTRRARQSARRATRGVEPVEPGYLSLRQASEYLAISEPVLRRLAATVCGPQALRIAGCSLTRFSKSDLDLWMHRQMEK